MLLDDRLVERVLRHWDDIAAHRLFPSKDQINRSLIGRDWANCALIDLHPFLEQSTLTDVGEKLLPSPGRSLDGTSVFKLPSNALLRVVISRLSIVASKKAPLAIGGLAPHLETAVLYRAALLPLADDGAQIDSVLLAANYRKLGSNPHI